MDEIEIQICQASSLDLAGIVELQAANQSDRGGALSASLSHDRMAEMMSEMPLVVARQDDRVVGFLMTGTRAMNADVPIIHEMFSAYAGDADSYVYGPICVAAEQRGKGLAQAMFSELKRLVPGREGVLFIRRDNSASLRAHQKMGMQEVSEFTFSVHGFVILSFVG